MRPRDRQRRRLRRAAQRGAAMVEGIVVIITMLVFLGMTVWATKAYGGKLDQASDTRRDVLFYASHDCSQSPPGSAVQSAEEEADATDGEDAPEATAAADRLAGRGRGEGAAVSRNWNMASTEKSSTVTGSAVVVSNPESGLNARREGLSANLRTGSWVACNERRYDNAWTQVFEFGWDFLRSAGGAL